ncbi:MAG TPA: hypothetical protein VLB80_02930 [Candidatus Babeliales bacterium]|nr:hypothetical protein [Candidatus Babeliales bacterium]
MKYNKLFITIALCIGFSSIINFCAATPSNAGWMNFGIYNSMNWAYSRVTDTFQKIRIPASLTNTISAWGGRKALVIATVAIVALIAIYGKDNNIRKWFNKMFGQSPSDSNNDNFINSKPSNEVIANVYKSKLDENGWDGGIIKELRAENASDSIHREEYDKILDGILISHYTPKIISELKKIPVDSRDKVMENVHRILEMGGVNALSHDREGPTRSRLSDGSEMGIWGTKNKAILTVKKETKAFTTIPYESILSSQQPWTTETIKQKAITFYNNL